jgi:hypothetical protein
MKLIVIDKEVWKRDYSENAHLITFNKHKPASWDRIDYALLMADEEKPCAYITCREFDHETIYWQFGGALPDTIGTTKSLECFNMALEWAKDLYKRVTFLVENDNVPMLKLAMKRDFKIVGVKNFKGTILLEHLLEFHQ